MGAGFATVTDHEGVLVTSAEVNGFTLSELRFPAHYVQDGFEPEVPYLAVVLDGGLEKSFRFREMPLHEASAFTMPVGAAHGARFGSNGARIVIVRPRNAGYGPAGCFDRLVEFRGHRFSRLAWRLSAELRATDAAAPLASEALALELLAATSREARTEGSFRRPPAWLRSAEELLRTRLRACIGLGEVAEAVGVHPTHLARVFRARYGVSVGEYGRRLRLEWAAQEISRSDGSLAAIATQAGFADQSHFTRLFKVHFGVTPARYRQETRPLDASGVPS